MRGVAIVACACALASAFSAHGQERLAPGEAIPPAALEAAVDALVGQAMAEHHIVGASVAVVQDGRIALNKGYGVADVETGRPVDPDTTLFRIGSITKTFTWVALMTEVEAGRIGLDDPINDHLPPTLAIPEQGFDEPIRVRHLMTHTAGFEDRALGFMFFDDPARMPNLDERLRIGRPDRVRAPGEISTYSNYGAALAGALTAHDAGAEWRQVVEGRVLTPLGMMHTSVREPYPPRTDLPEPMSAALAGELARGYRWTGERHEPSPFEYMTPGAPAGVISSTSGDMARFMLMLLNDGALDGARVLNPASAAAFRTPMTDLPPEIGNWAAGFSELPGPGDFRSYGHDGGTAAFFSNMRLYPELGLGVFVTTNTAGGMALTGRLPDAIVERFYAPAGAQENAGAQGDVAKARAYAGSYRLTRRQESRLGGFISRLAVFPVRATDDGYLAVSIPGTSGRYAPRNGPGDAPGWFASVSSAEASWLPSTLVFENRNGVTMARTPSFALERVGALQSPFVVVLAGLLTVIAGAAALIGRGVRRVGRNLAHPAASRLQLAASALWLVSAGGLVAFGVGAAMDPYALLFHWPTAPILLFSAAALAASLASVGAAALLPAVWRARDVWTVWRKARFTTTTALFVLYGALLLSWGALQPWNP